jgi:hypothetical protein
MLTTAIELAETDHVIYFLLTAYVDTLDYYDPPRSFLSAHVRRLPITGQSDVSERLRILRDTLKSHVEDNPGVGVIIEEAIDVFSAASQRLSVVQTSAPFAMNGHRLGWRMTDCEAEELGKR